MKKHSIYVWWFDSRACAHWLIQCNCFYPKVRKLGQLYWRKFVLHPMWWSHLVMAMNTGAEIKPSTMIIAIRSTTRSKNMRVYITAMVWVLIDQSHWVQKLELQLNHVCRKIGWCCMVGCIGIRHYWLFIGGSNSFFTHSLDKSLLTL